MQGDQNQERDQHIDMNSIVKLIADEGGEWRVVRERRIVEWRAQESVCVCVCVWTRGGHVCVFCIIIK